VCEIVRLKLAHWSWGPRKIREFICAGMAWEEFVLDVAASKLDRDATTHRLRKLLKRLRTR
jgi:hypothetical protein